MPYGNCFSYYGYKTKNHIVEKDASNKEIFSLSLFSETTLALSCQSILELFWLPLSRKKEKKIRAIVL